MCSACFQARRSYQSVHYSVATPCHAVRSCRGIQSRGVTRPGTRPGTGTPAPLRVAEVEVAPAEQETASSNTRVSDQYRCVRALACGVWRHPFMHGAWAAMLLPCPGAGGFLAHQGRLEDCLGHPSRCKAHKAVNDCGYASCVFGHAQGLWGESEARAFLTLNVRSSGHAEGIVEGSTPHQLGSHNFDSVQA